jgi:hypothetical protein
VAISACGDNVAEPDVDEPAELVLLAGNIGGDGDADGVGTEARFSAPAAVAVDSVGRVYVADFNNQVVRRITSGNIVSTWAGTAGVSGNADGHGASAQFRGPNGIAIDSADNVYVSDGPNSTIRKITPDGDVTTLAGAAGISGSVDGVGNAAHFVFPSGIALDSGGCVYVSDVTTIRKISPAGVVTTLAGAAGSFGSVDGIGSAARFNWPGGLTVDSASNVYVVDSENDTIRKITPTGAVTTMAGSAGVNGSADGPSFTARFNYPVGIAVDGSGDVYITDSGNSVIRVLSGGVVTTLAGSVGSRGSSDGTGATARLAFPLGIASDRRGNFYVTDYDDNTIRTMTTEGLVTTIAGMAAIQGNEDGIGAQATFGAPRGLASDTAGNVYVVDIANFTIRAINLDGVVTTIAGVDGDGGSSDGSGGQARFYRPSGLAVDSAGALLIADSGNNKIRALTPAGVVTSIAGSGASGGADGAPDLASFSFPEGIAVDSSGSIYVADTDNDTIRRIYHQGVYTLAGIEGAVGGADGLAREARFNHPLSVVVRSDGPVFVADYLNHAIRRVEPDSGYVTTFAGTNGVPGSADGLGINAQFNSPTSVSVDRSDNIYVADNGNATIRRISPIGVVTTIAGTANARKIVLGRSLGLSRPWALVVIGDSLVIADSAAILLLRHGAR